MANLANQYLREIIKKECWDAMVVKGRSVNAFHLLLSVSNYPMKERTKAELDEVQYVINQRKIEQAESAASKDVVSSPPSARNTPLVGKKTSCWFQRFCSSRNIQPEFFSKERYEIHVNLFFFPVGCFHPF